MDDMLTLPELMEILKVSRASIYRLLRDDPAFPSAVKFGVRQNRWPRSEIEAWIEGRAALRA